MDVSCRHCHYRVPDRHIDTRRGIVQCPRCNAVSTLGREPSPGAAAPIAKPDAIELEPPGAAAGYRRSAAARLRVHWRWRSGIDFVFIFGALALWALIALYTADLGVLLLGGAAHFAIGLVLLYRGVAGRVNRSTISVVGDGVRVDSGPLYWPGRPAVAVAPVEQVFVQSRIRSGGAGGGPSTLRYALVAEHGGRRTDLLRNVRNIDEVLYLERAIEDALGVEDRRVAGEALPK